MEITSSTAVGGREYQEDRIVITGNGPNILIAVLDGHSGSECVDAASTTLPALFQKSDDLHTIYKALHEITKDLNSGSTASIALITPNFITAAVLGDSPIQLINDGVNITLPEHNVRSNSSERDSAMSRGGVVSHGYLFDPLLSWGSGLQMSRALGDKKLRRVLSSEPEVFYFKREEVTSLLIASDGLTDPAHDSVPFLLNKHIDALELVDRFKVSAFDNVSAVVVQFGGK